MRLIRRCALWTAVLLGSITLLVGIAALAGVQRMPIIQYLLYPGGMAAWAWHGDNYRDSTHFLSYAVPIGVGINFVAGLLLGIGVGVVLRAVRRRGRIPV